MVGDIIPDTIRLLPIAAEVVGINPRRLRRWIKEGRIKCYLWSKVATKPGRRVYLVDLAEIIDHVEKWTPTKDHAMRIQLAAKARAGKRRKADPTQFPTFPPPAA